MAHRNRDRFYEAVCLFCLLAAGLLFVVVRLSVDAEAGPPGSIDRLTLSQVQKDYLVKSAEQRVKSVAELTATLHTIGTRILIGSALAIYLVRTRRGGFKVPIIDIEVPLHWVQLALPAVMMFWFLDWGFTLHRAIDSRIEAWHVLTLLDEAGGIPTSPKEPLSVFAASQELRDNFFVDQWFIAFRPAYHSIPESALARWVNTVILICFGLVLSAGLAAGMASLANVRPVFPSSVGYRALFAAYPVAYAFFVLATPIMFVYGGFHTNWLLYVILFTSVPIAAVLLRIGQLPNDQDREPHKHQNFRCHYPNGPDTKASGTPLDPAI